MPVIYVFCFASVMQKQVNYHPHQDGHLACKKAGRRLVGGDHLTGALTSCTSSCYQHHLHHP